MPIPALEIEPPVPGNVGEPPLGPGAPASAFWALQPASDVAMANVNADPLNPLLRARAMGLGTVSHTSSPDNHFAQLSFGSHLSRMANIRVSIGTKNFRREGVVSSLRKKGT